MAQHQGSLFNEPPQVTLRDILDAAPAPSDPNVTDPARPRLTGQNAAIVERLRQGPATNRELAQIALKYTSRLSDIRDAGYSVNIVANDHATGLVTYQLAE